ncbi:MAG: hypothetical protein NT000_05200, partial [Proteobacteria bacterium]|nr:hypothetical protein [Pseudomonadota bacterium]
LNRHRFVLARAPLTILWLSISTGLCVYGAVTYWQTAMLYPTNPNSVFFNFTNRASCKNKKTS